MPEPIRIVRIIDRLNIGGPAKHVVWLTAALNHGEFSSTLITGIVPEGEGDMQYFADELGVRPVVIRELSRELSLRDLVVIGKLLRLLFRLQPQIIHTHKAKAGATGRVAAWLYRWLTPSALWFRPRSCRVVHTYHGHIFHSYYGRAKTRLFLAIERLLARWATDRIVTVSEQQRTEISDQFRVGRAEQFRVVPLGLDVDEIGSETGETRETGEKSRKGQRGEGSETGEKGASRSLRAEYSIPENVPLIGFVGRLCEVKNLPLLLEVAKWVTEQSVPARFLLIGDGHLRASLETQAQKLGLTDIVLFAGFRRDVLSLYGEMDIAVLTSLNEGTPLTLIEAMAAGRPVASTEVGGVADIMGAREGVMEGFSLWSHGITAPSGRAEALGRGLRYLLERAPLREAMGHRGHAFVKSRLTKDRLAEDIRKVYVEMLN
jgi:glycosyltransferase involved in cell wall biosynthesis